jgi:hypothetical protein
VLSSQRFLAMRSRESSRAGWRSRGRARCDVALVVVEGGVRGQLGHGGESLRVEPLREHLSVVGGGWIHNRI